VANARHYKQLMSYGFLLTWDTPLPPLPVDPNSTGKFIIRQIITLITKLFSLATKPSDQSCYFLLTEGKAVVVRWLPNRGRHLFAAAGQCGTSCFHLPFRLHASLWWLGLLPSFAIIVSWLST